MSNPNVLVNRQRYIGGSDLPNILNFNLKYNKSAYEWAKIKAGIIVNPFMGNEFTKYGQIMEPIIRSYINDKYDFNFIENTVVDEDKRLRSNCDGFDKKQKILLEIKTYGKILDVDYYIPQVQMYLEMFNVDECWLVGYQRPESFYKGIDYNLENDDNFFDLTFDEKQITIVKIHRDKNMWQRLYRNIINFQKAVELLKQNPDMAEDEFNSIMYGKEIIELKNKVNKIETSLVAFKKLETEYKLIKEKIYNIFDDYGIKTFDTELFRITKVEPIIIEKEVIDEKSLKINEPRIYDKYKLNKVTNRKGFILVTIRNYTKKELTGGIE